MLLTNYKVVNFDVLVSTKFHITHGGQYRRDYKKDKSQLVIGVSDHTKLYFIHRPAADGTYYSENIEDYFKKAITAGYVVKVDSSAQN